MLLWTGWMVPICLQYFVKFYRSKIRIKYASFQFIIFFMEEIFWEEIQHMGFAVLILQR